MGWPGWNALVFWRLRWLRGVSHGEVAVNLAVDIAAFTAVLYLTGGPTNPFVSLYLVPIALAATSLPARYAWSIGGLCGAGYTLLLAQHVPLPSVQGRFGGDFDLHVLGMWVNFLVAAALIVFFVGPTVERVGRRWADFANSYRIYSYTLFGLRAGWTSNRWRAFADLRNLTDEEYVVSHSVRNIAPAGEAILNPGEPLSAYFGVEMQFE